MANISPTKKKQTNSMPNISSTKKQTNTIPNIKSHKKQTNAMPNIAPPTKKQTNPMHNIAKWNKYCTCFESYTLISVTFLLSSGKITETQRFSSIANLKIKFFLLLQENLENITTKMVLFRVWFICLLVVGSYVCKLVCQSFGWWLCLVLGLSVCWWLCDSIISLSLGMVSVLDFFIRDLNQSHGI